MIPDLKELLERYANGERDFRSANLRRAELRYADFQGVDLQGVDLQGVDLRDANLTCANLASTNLAGTNLADASLGGVNLADANLAGATLTKADLRNANLGRANVTGANLTDANLSGASLMCANLTDADLRGANLTDASLHATTLTRANLMGSNLVGAHLHHASFVCANLRKANLSGTDLSDFNVSGADLRGAHLLGSRLCRSELRGCDLRGAILANADLTDADLRGANLGGANLIGANLGGANLALADFTDAQFKNTVLFGVDLAPIARTTIDHRGPSWIDWSAVVRSVNVPSLKDLLRRAGMPDVFVEYMVDCARSLDPAMVFSLLQSTFISYGGPDEGFARKLNIALEQRGVTTFFFKDDAIPGERLHRVMRKGVNDHDRTILICSEASLKRPGLLNELEETLAREARDGGQTYLIPVRLDDYVLGGWAPRNADLAQAVRDRVISDFRMHEDGDQFDTEVAKLIAALKKPVAGPIG